MLKNMYISITVASLLSSIQKAVDSDYMKLMELFWQIVM